MRISNIQVVALTKKIIEDRKDEREKKVLKIMKDPHIRAKVTLFKRMYGKWKKIGKEIQELTGYDPRYSSQITVRELAEKNISDVKSCWSAEEKLKNQIIIASIDSETMAELEKKIK